MANKKKILIVEDEAYLQDMYQLKLEKDGYEVLLASNGREGLGMALTELPDLILLDLIMPELNGYQVLQKLKEEAATKKIPVYIISNLGQSEEVKKGMDIGADGYIIKANITPAELSEQIEDIFKKVGIDISTERLATSKRLCAKRYESYQDRLKLD